MAAKKKKVISWQQTSPCTYCASPHHSKCRTGSTTVHPNQTPGVLVVGNEINKSDQKQKPRSGARRAAIRTNPSNGPADSRELLFQLVQATNLLQLLQTTATTTSGSDVSGRGFTGKARTNEGAPLAGSPLVPGRAHTGRPRTCPCGVSARDIAEEPSHTSDSVQKGGKNISSSRFLQASGKYNSRIVDGCYRSFETVEESTGKW
jgi:hypothetical protein